jgi:hypothetical protein
MGTMPYYGPTLAYAFDDAKIASLWFDHVVPLNPDDVHRWGAHQNTPAETILNEIMPPNITVNKEVIKRYAFYLVDNPEWGSWQDFSYNYPRPDLEPIVQTSSDLILFLENNIPNFGRRYQDVCMLERWLADNKKIDNNRRISEDVSTINNPYLQRLLADDKKIENNLGFSYVIPKLNLINSEYVTWDEIIEFRKDKESVRKLRQLRLFMHDTYQNKPAEYVCDDLMRRIDDYNDVVKQWRFKATVQSMQAVLSLKSLPAAAVAALMAQLGSTISMAAAVGTILELTNIGMSILEKRDELSQIQNSNPISYLIRVKKLGDSNSV